LSKGASDADLRERDFGHHDVVGKGGGAHVVVDRLAVAGEAAGAVRHQAAALRHADLLAQIGLLERQYSHCAAFRRVQRNDVVALLQGTHARPDIDHHARAFMAEDAGKMPSGIGAGERVLVGVADAGGLDLHQHFAGARAFQVHFSIVRGWPASQATAALVFMAIIAESPPKPYLHGADVSF
jgi:hypothetical protein